MSTFRVLLILLVLLSRTDHHFSRQSRDLGSGSPATSPIRATKWASMENTIGVITLNEKTQSSSADEIEIFNADGSTWYEFSFYEDSDKFYPTRTKADFQPFAFHQDYFLLVLKCVGEDVSRFKVVVNDATQLVKFIPKNDVILPSLKFESGIGWVKWKESQRILLEIFYFS